MRQWNILALAAVSLLIAATPAIPQERAPEVAPGGIIVLRGGAFANTDAQPPPPGPSNPLSTGSAVLRGSAFANSDAQPPPPGPSNPLSTGPDPEPGLSRSYEWDPGGFDNRLDRSGLTRQ